MRQHELLVLRGRQRVLAEFARPQRTIDQRHRHGLAFRLAERQPIAAREARRLGRRAFELVHHLTLGHIDGAKRHRKAGILGHKFQLHFAKADFAREWMRTAIAALGRIAERQQKALVTARQILQAQIAIGRKAQRLARQIADRRISVGLRRGFDQAIAAENIGDARHLLAAHRRALRQFRIAALIELRIEQTMSVVEGWAEDLAAGHVLEGR